MSFASAFNILHEGMGLTAFVSLPDRSSFLRLVLRSDGLLDERFSVNDAFAEAFFSSLPAEPVFQSKDFSCP